MCAHQVRSYGPSVTTNDHPTPPASSSPADGGSGLSHYEIRVRGRLGSRWAAWFDGLELTAGDDGTTVLRGPVVDQAALHGLLHKLRDLGLTLVSLTELAPDAAAEPSAVGATPIISHPTGATS
jgi:hypothetical protein